MRKSHNSLIFSPSDLTAFLENPFITWMNRFYLDYPDQCEPDEPSDEIAIILKKGLEHEKRFLQLLKDERRDVYTVAGRTGAWEQVVSAMRQGREVIYQATIEYGQFAGFADFLVKVDQPSKLGSHSYEVWDTKLSLKAKPYFVIQLCCYAEILEIIQGYRPKRIAVVLGDGSIKYFRTDDFFYYYLHLKEAFLEQQRTFDVDSRPHPLPEGRNGRWESFAKKWLNDNDHLSLIAGITMLQIQRFKNAGIETVAALASSDGALRVSKMSSSTRDKLISQARLQVASRELARPKFELVQPDPEDPFRGFALLPPAAELDVVLDLEGYPLVSRGLEYLFGTTYCEDGELKYRDWWSHDPQQEKEAFEAVVDFLYLRWRRNTGMHIYHYASYEPTALKRLMGKYGTREMETDELLRRQVFVDLYKIVRQGLRIGLPNYSIKEVERLYLDQREAGVSTAIESIVFYERWLEAQDGATWQDSNILRGIREYNRHDCESAWKLADWLRTVQKASGISHLSVSPGNGEDKRPEEDSNSSLARRLLEGVPGDRSGDPEGWRVQELLAWLLEFHRREDKPRWWAVFERWDMSEEELYEDLDCLAGLSRTERKPEQSAKSVLFEYRFDPDQDTKIKIGDSCLFSHVRDIEVKVGIHELDSEEGRIMLKMGPKALAKLGSAEPPKHLSLIPFDYVNSKVIVESIQRTVSYYERTGELPLALGDFLFRRRPRILSNPAGPILRNDTDLLNGVTEAVLNMEKTTLCIQGPPGTGKTFTAGHVILELLERKKRVGVSANSHKAICNLMACVLDSAREKKVALSAVKIGGEDEDHEQLEPYDSVTFVQNIKKVGSESHLIGGTAWAFSAEEAIGILDYLFVDEAGQVSVANLVGMAPSTSNIVLIGDQMQLGQPTQGSHPGESGMSTLEYLLQGHATIPDELGIFLATTWRLHPEVCRFISETVYEGRLNPQSHTAMRTVIPINGACWIDRAAGVLFILVEHTGNTQGSEEEVTVIKQIVSELLRSGQSNEHGKTENLTTDDILIVAPYNLQVRMLKASLGPDARVGTIDKFQGQEATVVIVSMCASVGEASPRGVEFLFNKNRLNVAISRTKSLAIVVGHPALVRTHCSTLRQMELVNLFCRVVTEGRRLP